MVSFDGKVQHTAGFMFGEECLHNRYRNGKLEGRVALILKNRPDWQRGLFNGIGGHTEEDENSFDVQCREFLEETGVETFHKDWEMYCRIEDGAYHGACDFFVGYSDYILSNIKTNTDEEIVIVELETMPWDKCVYDLRWLIPLGLDRMVVENNSVVTIKRN